MVTDELKQMVRSLLERVAPASEPDIDTPDSDEEPFAGVRVPLRPRPHLNSGGIALALPESDEE
jgi:hypothetical protein